MTCPSAAANSSWARASPRCASRNSASASCKSALARSAAACASEGSISSRICPAVTAPPSVSAASAIRTVPPTGLRKSKVRWLRNSPNDVSVGEIVCGITSTTFAAITRSRCGKLRGSCDMRSDTAPRTMLPAYPSKARVIAIKKIPTKLRRKNRISHSAFQNSLMVSISRQGELSSYTHE